MQRQSREAFGLLTISDEIVSSIEIHGAEVATRLEEKWTAKAAPPDSTTPQLEAATPPDYLGNLLDLRDGLNTSATSLNDADRVHVHELGKVIELREERDDLTESVYQTFSTMRRVIDDLHGEGKAFVLAAFEGPTGRTAKKLVRQVDLALPRLKSPNVKLIQGAIAGVTVDTAAMAAGLETMTDKLRVKQAEFERSRRVAQASRKEKQRRMDEHRTTTVWTARIVEGYYQLAGETELAERLRPATSSPGRPPGTNPPATGPDDTTPEETAPAEPAPDVPAPAEPFPDEPEDDTGEEPTLPVFLTSRGRASAT